MDNLVMHIDRRAIGFQRQFDNVYRAHYAGAKPSGPDS
jgi:hypothetical protein